ncbi:MAG: SDR family NAD(P)-dependent oxidoreductase, partial [bacterium]|nr:SDR family NAD(P)-dependent oxidoreductase [bacterium]
MTGKQVSNGNKSKAAPTGREIAVIGMAGRFPGAETIDEFWRNLKNGVESISFLTDTELEENGVGSKLIGDSNYVRANGSLANRDQFDAGFFGYTPLEAEIMNPQGRILHECAWEALENAGYDPEMYSGLIGLYAGAGSSTKWELLVYLSGKGAEIGEFSAVTLNDKDFINAGISYKLNLKGPVFSVHTACSTSLVAIHVACRALLTGECQMALAGGITAKTSDSSGYVYRPGMILSPDGHCRTFDQKAGGTVGGEGGGLVLLKHLKHAVADKDYIYAIIKGSAINNDGSQKVGFSAPSPDSQAEVIRTAQRIARVEPESISYIEAHGTGTTLGDPIEIEALTLAFNVPKQSFCAMGSVKSNIGHLDTGAGIAGFIKTTLALHNRLIPPSLHFQTPNAGIDFENSPFYVNTQLKEWENNQHPLRAGVSSMGIGGTNAHVILEEWPRPPLPTAATPDQLREKEFKLILLSARDKQALEDMTRNLARHFEKNPGIDLTSAAYTLQAGRRAFKHRQMLICSTPEEAALRLFSPEDGNVLRFTAEEQYKKVVFTFPGQGSQYMNMGLGLYRKESVFREEMDNCFRILNSLHDENIKEILYPSEAIDSGSDTQPGKIDETRIAQPVIFSFEYALAKLLMKWGIKPQAMIGHSIGEYVAACLSGVFSLEDALKLVFQRGRIMQQAEAGAMLGIRLPEDQLTPFWENHSELSLAAVNSPSHCVISGPFSAIAKCRQQLQAKGVECRQLHTSHAFHSALMEPVLEIFKDAFKGIRLNKPQIPYISNVTGKPVTRDEAMSPSYWAHHIRRTVRFADGLNPLFAEGSALFLEIGPGKTLSSFIKQRMEKEKQPHRFQSINFIRHAKENVKDDYFLLSKIGRLWLYGQTLDWDRFYSDNERYRIPLPTYPFTRRSYTSVSRAASLNSGKAFGGGRISDMDDWFYIPLWVRSFPGMSTFTSPPARFPWLVFCDQQGFASRLLAQLKQADLRVITVETGSVFNEREDCFTINPASPDTYHLLFKRLKQRGVIPRHILHFWGVTHLYPDLIPANYDSIQNLGLHSLLNIARAVGSHDITSEIRIDVITSHMQEVTGGDGMSPDKATVLGAVKVIPIEYHNISCRNIDILLPRPQSPGEENLIRQLLNEFFIDASDKLIAYRGNYRWKQTFKRNPVEKPRQPFPELKENGVYLIIGGFGGMGFTIAQYLATTTKARLVLVGRSEFPPKDQWEAWLASHKDDDKKSIVIEKLMQWEKAGNQVMVFSADVSDYEQMKSVISQVHEEFGSVNGLIHAAGVIDYGGVIQRRTREITESFMAPKVKGTLVLDRLLKDNPLDFQFLFSSLGNIFYSTKFAQVSYSASNEFLDAFSYYKTSRDMTFAVTINWCDWKEVGMSMKAIKHSHA